MINKKQTETEVFGVNYERYSLGKQLHKFTKELNLKTVCELPAHGAKAAPSLYSFDFARAGCDVTLVNGSHSALKFYKKLNLESQITFEECDSLSGTHFKDSAFDFVWNFAFLPTFPDKVSFIEEMIRISDRYVAVFSVDKRNIGFNMHKFAHWKTKIPWTHGDTHYNDPSFLKDFFKQQGLKDIQVGVVDCPVWPDSVGFRDIRLHRNPVDFSEMRWEVPYIDYVLNNEFPSWFKWVYAIEKLPLPLCIKHFYAHIFYVIGKKR